MNTTANRLLRRPADEVMSRPVVSIPQTLSIQATAHRLAEAGISGAPVVDEAGRCVGVVSASDLVRFLDRGPPGISRPDPLLEAPAAAVARYMTTDVVTASPDTPLGELARAMLDAHIHRVLITDADGLPLGVVSSTDILAVLAAEHLRQTAG